MTRRLGWTAAVAMMGPTGMLGASAMADVEIDADSYRLPDQGLLSLDASKVLSQPEGSAQSGPQASVSQPGADGERVPTYRLPALTIEGQPQTELRDSELVGTYAQPRWTTRRISPSTRIYVIPEGAVDIEYWYRPTFNRDGTIETRMLAELEIGLPYRFQLDLYLRTDQEDAGSKVFWGGQFEVRWALADWGKIWGNPTLYFEYINLLDRPDKIEPKLLLGGDICEGWHWGMNFVAELEINGPELEHEYEFTSTIIHTIVDDKFSAGMEFKFSLVDVKGDRGHYTTPFQIGPTMQWRPVERMFVNLETLVGFGGESPYGQITLNVGWEF